MRPGTGCSRFRVYPRGCGETLESVRVAALRRGLSPRVRGNPARRRSRPDSCRSIPAGAGKPPGSARLAAVRRVYPRGCGETGVTRSLTAPPPGLSPRVRGNHRIDGRLLRRRGSIPAGAGKPRRTSSGSCPARVYPRGCGETPWPVDWNDLERGLSPRVRGNPLRPEADRAGRGSIPAGAGKPRPAPGRRAQTGVYPRGCGETEIPAGTHQTIQGLSPRVRGNRLRPAARTRLGGSIPAGAGKPAWGPSFSLAGRVYPRGCGETKPSKNAFASPAGLSPRVRGNRRAGRGQRYGQGSIPAGAGKP